MAVKNTAKVVIDGKIITLGGYESQEYFQKVANYINNKIQELSQLKGYNRISIDQKNMLLSLNISDDYFKAKKKAEQYQENIDQQNQEIYNLKQDLIELQMQLDELKKNK